jgi:hypothetical protein
MQQGTKIESVINDPTIKAGIEASRLSQTRAIEEQAKVEGQLAEQRMVAYDTISQDIRQKQSEYEAAVNELKDKKLVDPESKRGVAQKIGAAIAMGLGAYAAAYTGSKNYAAEIINDTIARDIQVQEAEIRKLGVNVDEKKNALAFAYRKLGDLDQAKYAVQMAALSNAKQSVMDAAKKVDNAQAKAKAQSLIAAIDGNAAQLKAQASDKTVITSTSDTIRPTGGEKSMSVEQAKASEFADMMRKADTLLTPEVEQYATTLRSGAQQASLYPERAKTETQKRYDMAAGAWTEGYLRYASGAAIGKEEQQRVLGFAMPRAGDSKETLQMRREFRKSIADGIASGTYMSPQEMSKRQQPAQDLKKQFGFKGQ